MASQTTLNSNTVIYNDQVQTGYFERIQDVVDVFNAQSNGAILLNSTAIPGDLRQQAFYKIGGSIAHRNVDTDAAVETARITADEMVGVKVPWKYGPYAATEEAFKRRGRSPAEFSQMLGQDMADAVMEGWLQYSVAALEAAIRSNPAMVTAGSFVADGKKVLTKGLRLMGDRFGRIASWVMDSEAYFDIVDTAIDNKIFEEAGVVVYGGTPGTMGKPVIVTDNAPSGVIMGLQGGALTAIESQAPGMRTYDIDDQENLAIGFRAEGTFNVEVMGYSWDASEGGVNPNLSAIGASANWVKYATSNKATAGFIIDLNTGSGS